MTITSQVSGHFRIVRAWGPHLEEVMQAQRATLCSAVSSPGDALEGLVVKGERVVREADELLLRVVRGCAAWEAGDPSGVDNHVSGVGVQALSTRAVTAKRFIVRRAERECSAAPELDDRHGLPLCLVGSRVLGRDVGAVPVWVLLQDEWVKIVRCPSAIPYGGVVFHGGNASVGSAYSSPLEAALSPWATRSPPRLSASIATHATRGLRNTNRACVGSSWVHHDRSWSRTGSPSDLWRPGGYRHARSAGSHCRPRATPDRAGSAKATNDRMSSAKDSGVRSSSCCRRRHAAHFA